MSSLRLIASLSHADNHDAPRSPGDRRGKPDRRVYERRNRIYPFESREARLRFAAQAAGFGTYDLDCATGDSVWSPELRIMAGLPPDDGPLSTEQAESLIHPEDRQRFLDKLWSSLNPKGGGEFEYDHRLLRPDGTVRWVRTKGRTFFVGEGRHRRGIAATGVVMDITASRTAERELAEGREELAKLLDSALEAIVTIDNDQRIVGFNASAAQLFRCPREEAIGSPLVRFIPERYRQAHGSHIDNFAKEGTTARTMGIPGVFSGQREDGEEFPIEASIAKVEVGGHTRMTVFLRDITDRVKGDEALRRSKEDLELAIQAGNIGIWHCVQGTEQIECSARFKEIFGIPPGEPVSHERVMAAIHPDDRQQVEAAIARSLEKDEEYKAEFRIVWPDRSPHWVHERGRNLHDPATGQAIGMRGISLDISERKRHEQALLGRNEQLECSIADRTRELVRANEALERSNLELQQFAFIAAHDLQTPLRSISGFAQLLQKDFHGRLGPVADNWLDQLVRSVHRMRDVIRDVLAYSRLESRGEAFHTIDFNQLFDDVVATLDAPIREAGAQVLRGDLPTVEGDRSQLGQVLQNLIENALKYRRDEQPHIYVSAHKQEEGWCFSVEDNGIGIAEKHLEQIFEIFRRLHTVQEFPGTGIGLAICRRVIHRHGGKIWVESQPGKGSVFHFLLPERQ